MSDESNIIGEIIAAKTERLSEEIRKHAEGKLKDLFRAISEIIPLRSVELFFFTPYFNDGDPCVKKFRINIYFLKDGGYEYKIKYKIESAFYDACNLLMNSFNEESVVITRDGIYIDDYTDHD